MVALQMPGICGLGLQQQMHERQLLVPLVFVSGSNNLGGAVAAMRAGAIDFLQKLAERLFISTKTAEEHRASLLRKMAVRNTTQLASLMGKRRPPAD